MIAFWKSKISEDKMRRPLPAYWERPPPETWVGYEPEYQLHRDDEPAPPPSEHRPCQPEGGQQPGARLASPGRAGARLDKGGAAGTDPGRGLAAIHTRRTDGFLLY